MPKSKREPNNRPLLLFVCSGNICRSPIAEVIAAHAAQAAGLDIRVASSGTMALVGYPAEETARQVVAELGLALQSHRARQTTRHQLREAALVVAATRQHYAWLRLHDPGASHVVSFDELTGLGDIPDPYGAGPQEYRVVRDMLVAGMPRVLDALKARQRKSAND